MIKNKKPFYRKKKFFIAIVIAILVVGGSVFYMKAIKTPEVTSTPSTSQSEDSAAAEQGVSQKNSTSAQGTTTGEKQSGSPATPGSVAAPQGNFVSNHRVGTGDSIESICSTTKGAKCNISFTSGGTTKSLGEKTVNEDGTASWVWTPASIGLVAGSWQITATAILDGAQNSSKDPRNLEVL